MEQAQNQSDTIYAMSDEEFLQLDASQLNSNQETVTDETQEIAVPSSPDNAPATEETAEAQGQVSEETSDEVSQTPEQTSATETTPITEPEKTEIDYQAFYESVTKPFVANGKETQVTNPDDMIRLMQQGAGYHKKMAALKPVTRVGKLLEDNGLMDETKINYLIDLHNKKPEAIAAFIKETGIDLYDFDVAAGDNYAPQIRQVDDSSLELQTVLDDLQTNSQTYERTIGIVGNQWDGTSRQILAQHPELIRIIDSQVQDGTYDKISQIVEYERMMGRLVGVSDLHAYKQVGEQLFGNVQQPQQAPTHTQTPAAVTTTTVTTPVVPQRSQQTFEQRKKAAASPRQGAADVKQSINTLALSDEEFLKLQVR